MDNGILTLFTLILTGFGIFGGWTFKSLDESVKKLEIKNTELNAKIDFLQKENNSLGQFLNSFFFNFSITANKNNVRVDPQITDLIRNSQKELANIIDYFEREKIEREKNKIKF